ncbi:uncharacterized protein LOC124664858 [Lolium rigidum]|uniref:uncharacterized protein LOC124664858 n=1 Tax=Lolium rigidum TaxID=89674 RepID=UPI001F5C8D98|nr:uncharacterized protein LOC124664858 [Lolium rigidum]
MREAVVRAGKPAATARRGDPSSSFFFPRIERVLPYVPSDGSGRRRGYFQGVPGRASSFGGDDDELDSKVQASVHEHGGGFSRVFCDRRKTALLHPSLAEKLGEDDHGQQLGEVEMSWTPQAQPSRWPVVETVF